MGRPAWGWWPGVKNGIHLCPRVLAHRQPSGASQSRCMRADGQRFRHGPIVALAHLSLVTDVAHRRAGGNALAPQLLLRSG